VPGDTNCGCKRVTGVEHPPLHFSGTEFAKRNRDIVKRRARGETYTSIGCLHGISSSRVWQIVYRAQHEDRKKKSA
jgi:DNA-binding CsgD family transcriptional regulator